MQAVGQRHLGAGAADAAHHHGVGADLSGPVPRLLKAEQSAKRLKTLMSTVVEKRGEITHAAPRDSRYLLWPHGGAAHQRAGWTRHHTLLRHRLVNFWSSYLDREERKLRNASTYVLDHTGIHCVLVKRHHSSPKYYSSSKYTSTTECAQGCVLAPPILLNMHQTRSVRTTRYPIMHFTSATNRSNDGGKIRT